MRKPKRVVVWFSCGAASAVCAKLIVTEYGKTDIPVEIVYTDPGTYSHGKIGEHPDNKRFIKEVEEWIGLPVRILKHDKYSDPMDVFRGEKYIVGQYGAPCTRSLKKRLREAFQEPGDLQVFGFTAEESARAERFRKSNPEVSLHTPLISRGLTKSDCLGFLAESGISIPAMYQMGYRNNNCIGCVKGGAGYWNKIRKDFPDVFESMSKLEREIGATIIRINGKPTFLDELDPDCGNHKDEPDIECGLLCIGALMEVQDCEI